jgi:hypothetical protein
MFDQLINLIRENAGSGIMNNNAIPNEKNEQAVETAGSSIMATLQNALSGGRLNDVLGFFKGDQAASGNIVQEATSKYAEDLQNNVGLNEADARQAAVQVVPQTMQQLANKTADPNDHSFNIQEIFNKISGGKTVGLDLQGMLNRFGGGKLDKDGDGDVDLKDLQAMFTGGTGIMGNLKGLFS